MTQIDVEVIESTAGEVAAELARRGVDPARLVTVIVEPEDWLTRGRRESQLRVEAAGLSDRAIDGLIKEARREVNEEVRGGVTPQVHHAVAKPTLEKAMNVTAMACVSASSVCVESSR